MRPSNSSMFRSLLVAGLLLSGVDAQSRAICGPPPGQNSPSSRFTAPLVVFLTAIFPLGFFLVVFSQRLARFTLGVSYGVTLSALAWLIIFNSIPAPRLPTASGNSDFDNAIPGGLRGSGRVLSLPIFAELLIAVIAFTFLLLGLSLSYFKFAMGKGRIVGMFLITLFGGLSFGFALVLMRPGLLIPVYGANWILILVAVIVGIVLLIKWTRLEMIMACVSIGVFLMALSVDTVIHRGQGLLIGLRVLLSDDHSTFKNCYRPQITSLFIAGASQLLVPPISYLHWKYARGLWKYEWNIRNPPPPSSPSDDLEAGLSKSPPYILSRHSRAVNGAQLFFSTARESIFSRTRRSSFYPTESIHTLRTPLPTENQMSLPRTERPKPTHKSNLRLNKAKIGGPVQYVENTHWRI